MPSGNKRQELRKTLKKKTLYRALSEDSEATIHAVINQNAMFSQMRRLRTDIPDDHKKEIAQIRQEEQLFSMLKRKFNELGLPDDILEPLPRAIKQLNLLERDIHNHDIRWTYNGYDLDALLSLIHVFPQSDTIH